MNWFLTTFRLKRRDVFLFFVQKTKKFVQIFQKDKDVFIKIS